MNNEAGIECHYCHGRFPRGEITRDHIVPKALGGRDGNYNIVLACIPCNRRKDAEWPTCECSFCRNAIAVHENYGPRQSAKQMISAVSKYDDYGVGVGPRCSVCGLITWDPSNCGWCAAENRLAAQA